MRECCTDHMGKPKNKYSREEDALEVARYLELIKGIYVIVYQCDVGDGWHLTSQDVSQQPSPHRVLNAHVIRNQPQNIKKRKGSALGKSLGKELVEKIRDVVHKQNVEKLKDKRIILRDQRKLKSRK